MVWACIPLRISTLSPRCRPLGQPATERSAHSSRLSEEDSSPLSVRTTVSPQIKYVGKKVIYPLSAGRIRFTIQVEWSGEFEHPDDLLGVLNF